MRSYLDFEKPVGELEQKIEELRAMQESGDVSVAPSERRRFVHGKADRLRKFNFFWVVGDNMTYAKRLKALMFGLAAAASIPALARPEPVVTGRPVELQYGISEGKPFKLGRIIIKGNGPLQQNIIAGSTTLSGNAPTARQLELNEETSIAAHTTLLIACSK